MMPSSPSDNANGVVTGMGSARSEGAAAVGPEAFIGSAIDEGVAAAGLEISIGSAIDEGVDSARDEDAVVTGPALTGSSTLDLSTDTGTGTSLSFE